MSKVTLPYATVDVFTNTAFTGNQLGVVLLDETSSQTLSQKQKHEITREFNYSETVFIHPFDNTTSTRRVDIWTLTSEIPFAGHPTIGAIHYIINNLSPEKESSDGKCILQLKAGRVVGYLDRGTGYAKAEIPHDVHINVVEIGWDKITSSQPALGALQANPEMMRKHHKAVAIVKGMNFVLVDLTEQPELLSKVEIVNQNVVNVTDLDPGWDTGLMGTLYFVRKPDQGDGIRKMSQRVVVIGLEDPATGSASSALCAFVALEEASAGTTQRFELEQGTQMGRRSIIGCQVNLDASGTGIDRIVLSGQVIQTMKGELTYELESLGQE